MTIARIVAWTLAGGWKKLLLVLVALAIGWLVWAIWDAGYQTAEQKCDAAAALARARKAERERDAAGTLATSQQQTAAALAARDLAAQEQIRDLTSEIERLRAAARPGVAPGAGALLDDRCGLTDRGLQLLGR
ncbi:hypothetical protein PQJ75_13905 [Rhodoplanes sp. TEM]|uniref:Uncharacterized protein n=1 Tax=Rhodoplanes tepidamans TaxID=200616 RepID=A0ABT5JF85_RHOTP|nr:MULTISPECIES: hypothetical protein [Rhodoplanes]MDC7787986.1 hypothetical protein [Rhodoplanes tepidamans]MDC7984826.1 hypothetical protein [Rhodoplanes sp. TEM]MDQ0358415.1 uncharacterized protein HemX [Rhodoplanes tepidamans]